MGIGDDIESKCRRAGEVNRPGQEKQGLLVEKARRVEETSRVLSISSYVGRSDYDMNIQED